MRDLVGRIPIAAFDAGRMGSLRALRALDSSSDASG